jgi:curved DNA-binding protein CbpA
VPDNDWQSEIGRLQRREHGARTILGVSKDADRAEIRHAFRRASLAHHPDRNPGDAGSAARFHLICCAYKFLTEGEACAALDELECPPAAHADGKYCLDNPWGYWCWWREKYSGDPLREKEKDDACF